MASTPAGRDSIAPQDRLKIILIDDADFNHSSFALAGIRGHNVVDFQEVEAAHRYLNRLNANEVDVLLTDLWMPTDAPEGDVQYSTDATDRHAGLDIPSGFAFAIRVANFGVPVAICTDGHHHSDRLVRLAHQSTVTPVYGAGTILLFEAFQFSVPGVRWVEKYHRIMRVTDLPVKNTTKRGKPRFVVFDLDDERCSEPVDDVPTRKTRLVKDWGAVLEARLKMALRPPGYKTNPKVKES